MDEKKILPHFYIGDSLGGQQEWYSRITDFGMHVGGCAAITACDCAIYFAKYFGLSGLYQFDLKNVTQVEYLEFGRIMEPYLYPRWSGVDKLEIYLDGFGRFLQDHGVTNVKLSAWSGDENFSDTREIVRRKIDSNLPIPCLTLNHQSSALEDYIWHWFILNGYEIRGENFFVQAVSYGVGRWFDLSTLWDTGYQRKGGLIIFDCV